MEYILFVYGQLKKGGLLHLHMKESTFMGKYELKDYSIATYGPNVMFLNHDRGNSAIGEIYKINEANKVKLDSIEKGFTFTEVAPYVFAYII